MGKYIDDGDADLELEDYRAPDGSRVTQQIADAAVQAALQRTRGAGGRPSLTAPGEVSPTVNARVSVMVKDQLKQLAATRGVSESALVREAIEDLVARSGR